MILTFRFWVFLLGPFLRFLQSTWHPKISFKFNERFEVEPLALGPASFTYFQDEDHREQFVLEIFIFYLIFKGFLNIGIASALLPAKITRRKRIQKNFNIQNDDPESFSSDYSSFVPVTFNDFDGPVVSSVSSSDSFEDPVFDRDEMCTDPHDAICEPEEQTCTAEMKKEDNCSCDCVQVLFEGFTRSRINIRSRHSLASSILQSWSMFAAARSTFGTV